MPSWGKHSVLFHKALFSFQHFFLSEIWMEIKSMFIQLVYDTKLWRERYYIEWQNCIQKDCKTLERWPKANKGAKYKFYIWIKKIKTQLYKYRMENTWVKSNKRWASFRVTVNCKLNHEPTLWCGSEKMIIYSSVCFNIIMYSVQMKVANCIVYCTGHKPSGMMCSN